ncbi:MAG: ornithine cyclodeaminase [Ruminococcaceae bacterium]|nr:ornithine cyclodeaminase [Oscillospiraceae bacterium]
MGKKTEFLYLNEKEMIEAGVLDYKRCIDVEEEVFKLLSVGDYVMGGDKHNSHGIMMKFPKESPFPNMPVDAPDRRFMAMPAYVGGRFNVAGQKWYGSNIINPQRGLPRSILMVMLNDADTCEPLALMAGNLISSVRTGCVPGVGVRHLANKNAKICSCIGAGPVSMACFEGIMCEAENLEEIVVCDLILEKAQAFADEMAKKYGLKAYATTNLEEAVRKGDIVSVAASSVKPIKLENEWLKKGSLLIFSGRGQVDEEYFTTSKVIWDNTKMHEVYYDEHMLLPENERFINGIAVQIYRFMFEGKLPPITEGVSLGDVICGSKKGRESEDERICFIASGMPVWDVAWGYELYENALKKGLGQKLLLWDDPYLA